MSEVLPIIKWTEGRMKPWRSDFILPNDGEYAPLHEVGGRKNDRHSYVTVVLDDAKAEAIEEAYADHHWYREGIEAVLDILGVEFLGDPRGMDELHIRNLRPAEEQSRYSYAHLVNLWEGPGTYFIDVNHEADLLDLEHAEHLTYECADVDEWIAAVERWFGGIVIAGKVDEDVPITKESER